MKNDDLLCCSLKNDGFLPLAWESPETKTVSLIVLKFRRSTGLVGFFRK